MKEANTIKVVLLGESNAGKSSVCERYMLGDDYKQRYRATIGIDFVKTQLDLNNICCDLQIQDATGTESFSSMYRVYLRETQACILVIDLTRDPEIVFKDLRSYFKALIDFTDYPEIPVILVGSKCDLVLHRKISQEQLENLSEILGMPYMECSAVKNINITGLFELAAKMVVMKNMSDTEVIEAKTNLRFFTDPNLPNQEEDLGKRKVMKIALFDKFIENKVWLFPSRADVKSSKN